MERNILSDEIVTSLSLGSINYALSNDKLSRMFSVTSTKFRIVDENNVNKVMLFNKIDLNTLLKDMDLDISKAPYYDLEIDPVNPLPLPETSTVSNEFLVNRFNQFTKRIGITNLHSDQVELSFDHPMLEVKVKEDHQCLKGTFKVKIVETLNIEQPQK